MIKGNRVTDAGLAITLLAVCAGVGCLDSGVLLGLVGVLVGASTIAIGVRRMGEEPVTPTCLAALARLGALAAFPRRNLAVVGLIMASPAVTTLAGGDEVGADDTGRRSTMILGSRVTATGLAIMLLAVSAGVGSGDFGMLLGLVGVLVSANTITVGVRRMGEEPATSTCPSALARLGVLPVFLRRNLAVVGLIMASYAITAVAGDEAGPVLCCGTVPLFLLGICLINIGFTSLHGRADR